MPSVSETTQDRERSALHVSGAGPSGLAAAIVAARAGLAVVVHERFADVGRRFHDDFQGLENWTTPGDVLEELAALGIEPTFEHTPFRDTVAFDPTGREYVYRSSEPYYYLVRRGPGEGTLDSSLKRQAEQAGVAIRFGETRRHLAQGGIVAEGPHGSDAIAVGYTFETGRSDGAYAAVSDRLAPQGYSYLLIAGGRGTIASCMFTDFHNEKTYLERTVEFFEGKVGRLEMRSRRRFGGTGNFVLRPRARRGRLLYVGEAAGFQDALWGFGMRYAMVSGALAAKAFAAGRPESYDTAWEKRLGGLLRTGFVNRYLYARLGEPGYAELTRRIGRARDPRRWLGRHYRPSRLKWPLLPLARRAIETNRRENQCPVEGCDCTWCRCSHEAAAGTPLAKGAK